MINKSAKKRTSYNPNTALYPAKDTSAPLMYRDKLSDTLIGEFKQPRALGKVLTYGKNRYKVINDLGTVKAHNKTFYKYSLIDLEPRKTIADVSNK